MGDILEILDKKGIKGFTYQDYLKYKELEEKEVIKRRKLREKIENYEPYNQQEEKDKRVMLECIDIFDMFYSPLTRGNEFAHFTASSWAVNKERTKVLMIYHNIYQSWSWTGGHSDGEADLLKVAIKELKEETGVQNVKVLNNGDIFSLEILTVDGHVKRGNYVTSHLHLNLTYLLEVYEKETFHINEYENIGVKWVPINEVKNVSNETWIKENIYTKLNQKTETKKQI